MRTAPSGSRVDLNVSAEEVTFMKIEIREVEDIKATSIHQVEGAGGA